MGRDGPRTSVTAKMCLSSRILPPWARFHTAATGKNTGNRRATGRAAREPARAVRTRRQASPPAKDARWDEKEGPWPPCSTTSTGEATSRWRRTRSTRWTASCSASSRTATSRASCPRQASAGPSRLPRRPGASTRRTPRRPRHPTPSAASRRSRPSRSAAWPPRGAFATRRSRATTSTSTTRWASSSPPSACGWTTGAPTSPFAGPTTRSPAGARTSR